MPVQCSIPVHVAEKEGFDENQATARRFGGAHSLVQGLCKDIMIFISAFFYFYLVSLIPSGIFQ